MRSWWIAIPLVLAAACRSDTTSTGDAFVGVPANLTYTVDPASQTGDPSGVLLRWDLDSDPDLAVWNIYSRSSTDGSYRLRGSTTSNSFHDRGVPDLQYYVTAEDVNGGETPPSNVVTVDERLALARPTSLSSTSLDGAIALSGSGNAAAADPAAFSSYRVYSTSYNLDNDTCGATWALEGTTVSPEFISGVLVNGSPRCFGVTAVSVEGFESLWSPIRSDTPRPDSRNVAIYARQAQSAGSAFRFWRDLNLDGGVQDAELGLVLDGSAADADFRVERDGTGALFLAPVRSGTRVARYGDAPVGDLTNIDVAPVAGYSTVPIEALPGWGYVFEMPGGDGFLRYGAARVTHVGQNFLILDWSYQTDPGNPELVVGAPR
jgi:hypothetical protein